MCRDEHHEDLLGLAFSLSQWSVVAEKARSMHSTL